MLLNLYQPSWDTGLSSIPVDKQQEKDIKTIKEISHLANDYKKLILKQKEIEDPDQFIKSNIGKQNAKTVITQKTDDLLNSTIHQSLATVLQNTVLR